jgi:hypothetical protein
MQDAIPRVLVQFEANVLFIEVSGVIHQAVCHCKMHMHRDKRRHDRLTGEVNHRGSLGDRDTFRGSHALDAVIPDHQDAILDWITPISVDYPGTNECGKPFDWSDIRLPAPGDQSRNQPQHCQFLQHHVFFLQLCVETMQANVFGCRT